MTISISRRTMLGGTIAGCASALSPMLAARAHDGFASIGSWLEMNSAPFGVQEIYPTVYRSITSGADGVKPSFNSYLVNVGGVTGIDRGMIEATRSMTIYDPLTDEWYSGPSLPTPRHHIAAIANSGKIFAIGGYFADSGASWMMSERVFVLDDIDRGEWRDAPALPIPQAEGIVASLEGAIHYVGGRSPAGSLNAQWSDHIDTDAHRVFIAADNRWAQARPIPFARHGAASATFNNTLYVFGGVRMDGQVTDRVDVYDPLADHWQPAAPIPTSTDTRAPLGRTGFAAALWDSKIYIFGGDWYKDSAYGVYADVHEYDPLEDKWRTVAAMPRPRHGLGAVTLNDGIYVFGGSNNNGTSGISATLDRFSI